MTNNDKSKKLLYLRRVLLKLVLLFYDIIAINISFILTLYIRFYVAKEMHAGSVLFFERFTHYSPYYTLFCIVVFACFKLYNGMWKYAGFHDMNRIIIANIICALGHIIGTLVFAQRMPRSFYLIGGICQLCLVGFVRFSFRLLEIERKLIFGTQNKSGIRAMIIGVSGTTRTLIRRLENDNAIHPVCIVDYEIIGMGNILDGIPVVSGIDNLRDTISKYHVNYVIFAAYSMPEDLRKKIRKICLDLNIEVEDYCDDLNSNASLISYNELIDKITSNIRIIYNKTSVGDNDIAAYINEINKFKIVGLSASSDTIYIDLKDKNNGKLDLNEEWVKEQESKTGEQISFF